MQQQRNNMQMQPQQPMQEQPNDAHLMEEGGQVVDDVTDNRLILDWGVVYTFFK